VGHSGLDLLTLSFSHFDPLRKWRPKAPFLELAVSVALKK
jgi:hypothetical protein